MQDLKTWLEAQSAGIRTFSEFQHQANELARTNPANAAILTLLARLAERFVTRFEGEPVAVEDAAAAIEELKRVLAQAMTAADGSSEDQLAFANTLATVDLRAA